MQGKMHYFVSPHPEHPDLYLTACGRAMSADRGSVDPNAVDQSWGRCIKCLYRVWHDVPALQAREMEG